VEEGKSHGIGMISAGAALEIFKKGIEIGLGDKDLSSVAETFRKTK